MTFRVVDAEEVARLVPLNAAIDALDAGFEGDLPEAAPRARLRVGDGDLLVMPAVGEQGAGVKVVTVNPSNPERGLPLIHAVYVFFSPRTLEASAVIDGESLTAIRTAAVSGVATRYLARPEARRLVIFGAGTQASCHFDAMRAVRPIEELRVVSRTRGRAEKLAERADSAGIDAEVSEPEAVAGADIVCTCTTSREPLFEGSLLRDGAHVNAVGAYQPDARELDDETMRRARVVVETREAALSEAGDVVMPIEAGVISSDDVAELADVVRGVRVRTSADDVTVFKSVGVAFEDLIVAAAAADRLQR